MTERGDEFYIITLKVNPKRDPTLEIPVIEKGPRAYQFMIKAVDTNTINTGIPLQLRDTSIPF